MFKEFVAKEPSYRKKEKMSFSVVYDVLPTKPGGEITTDTLDIVTETEAVAKQ